MKTETSLRRTHLLATLTVTSVVLGSSLLLSGCLPTSETTTDLEQKVGDTTMTGIVSEVGGQFFLDTGSGQPQSIDSYSVQLKDFVGQTVTVTGQYSGNTLFVGSLESGQRDGQSSLIQPVQAAEPDESEDIETESTRPVELKQLSAYEKQQLLQAGVDPSRL